ncbi:MAG: hypothetical protein NTU51_01205 [Bacteroidetes bacterium]|nr:hypothetical protein [Bacteroidota bacterium]
MDKLKLPVLLLFLTLQVNALHAQQRHTIEIVGGARSIISNNNIKVRDSVPDTTTIKRNTGGYALIDLGVDVRPNKYVEILGMFRIRNDYGGFWGSGVSFDVRQLWLKGIIGNVVRYQVGDLNLKQTPFTLYNHHADRIDSLPAIFNLQNEIISYEKFYMDNTWRQQGVNVDFGLNFSKILKEIDFTGYMTRLNGTNFVTIPDRLMSGASVNIIQSRHVNFGYNGFWVFDVKGTVPDSSLYNNSVNTINLGYVTDFRNNMRLDCKAEFGWSKSVWSKDVDASQLKDYFIHAYATLNLPKQNLDFTLGYLNVGPDFRSIGAQSKDINYAAAPNYYNYYTNKQIARPLSVFDVVRNENIYNTSVSSNLMPSNPVYNNVLPYGLATFNIQGGYAKINYTYPEGIAVNFEEYVLSEIRGQGTNSLKLFTQSKLLAQFEINKLAHFSKRLKVNLGANYQTTWRSSDAAIEDVALNSLQFHAGIEFEFIKKMDLLLGFVGLFNKGNDFIPVRNSYSKVEYFEKVNYDLSQNYSGAGIRFRFLSDRIYLCALYQFNTYTDKQNTNPSYNLDQFALIFNMTF